MKTKYMFLALLTSLLFLYCSPNIIDGDLSFDIGDINVPWYGSINVSDDCDCLQDEFPWNCSDSYGIIEDEFKRLLEIINQSDEPCIYIQGIDYNGEDFEGYVISYHPKS